MLVVTSAIHLQEWLNGELRLYKQWHIHNRFIQSSQALNLILPGGGGGILPALTLTNYNF